jgi:hypothetical protein
LKYLVVYCDGRTNVCQGYHIKDSLEEAVKFAEKVSSNGFVVKIYEDVPLEIYEPEHEPYDYKRKKNR